MGLREFSLIVSNTSLLYEQIFIKRFVNANIVQMQIIPKIKCGLKSPER